MLRCTHRVIFKCKRCPTFSRLGMESLSKDCQCGCDVGFQPGPLHSKANTISVDVANMHLIGIEMSAAMRDSSLCAASSESYN